MSLQPTASSESEELLAEVYNASLLSMQHSMPTAQPLTRCYLEAHDEIPLGNTFLNFSAMEPDLEHRPRRSRSVGPCCCCCRSLAAEAEGHAKVEPILGTGLDSIEASQVDHLGMATGTTPEDAESGSVQSSPQVSLDLGSKAVQRPQSEQAKKRARCHKRKSPRASPEAREGPKIVDITGRNTPHAPGEAATRTHAAALQAPLASYTTIILQNLPVMLTQMGLLRTLEQHGYKNTFDFCYLPVDFLTGDCRGYGFINFKTCEVASSFKRAWHKSRVFCDCNHVKPVLADVAELQGVEALLGQPSMRKLQRVKNLQYRPYIALEACAGQ